MSTKILSTNNPPYSPSRVDGGNYIRKSLKIHDENIKEILDVGCGKLYLLNILNKLTFKGNYLGIDPFIHNQKIKSHGKYVTKRADILTFKSKRKFDLITCLWVLEHIKNDKKAIIKMSRLLSKNGILIIAVPTIWTWPFEFGRHGFHYYRLKKLLYYSHIGHLEVKSIYSSGGLLGFLFMIFYNWPRFVILVLALPLYKILLLTNATTLSWPHYSKKVINGTWYKYHKVQMFVRLHNWVVKSIVVADNLFKIFPQSYIIILQKI